MTYASTERTIAHRDYELDSIKRIEQEWADQQDEPGPPSEMLAADHKGGGIPRRTMQR
jgi:hypothetical protein